MTISFSERYAPERLAEDEALERSRAHLDLMRARRSVRHFSDEPVPRELVENALREPAALDVRRHLGLGDEGADPRRGRA